MAQVNAAPVASTTASSTTLVDTVVLTPISQTSTTTVTSGSTLITVTATAGMSLYQWVVADEGTANEETVRISAVNSGTTFTANFRNAHGPSSWTITTPNQRQVMVVGDPTTSANLLAIDSAGNASVNLGKVGGTSVALGQTTMSASLPVALASDQGNVAISIPIASVITGTITASGTANGVVGTISSPTILVTVHGTYNAILQFHGSDDAGTTYYPVSACRTDGTDTAEQTTQTMANASTAWYVKCDGYNRLRVYASTYTSGTVSVRMTPVMISMAAPIPPLGKAGTWASLPTNGTTSTPVVVGTGPPSIYSGMEIRLTYGATAGVVPYGITMTGTAPSSPGAAAFVTVTGPTAAPDVPPIYIPLISPAQPYFAAVLGTTTPQYRWI